jgi:hypothetical protein
MGHERRHQLLALLNISDAVERGGKPGAQLAGARRRDRAVQELQQTAAAVTQGALQQLQGLRAWAQGVRG